MSGALDHQLGIAAETTYGTSVTPTRFYEWDQDRSTQNWDPKIIVGTGMQVGDGGFERANRSVAVLGQGNGSIGLDYQTRGMGLLMDSFFGNGVSTLVGGTTYQELMSSALTGALLPARTIEYGIVRTDAAGTPDSYRYAGCTFTKLGISCATGDVVKATAEWDGRSQTLTTPPATASYPAGLSTPFHFGLAAVTFGGTVVLPTTTALASGGTAVTDFRSFEFNMDNQPDTDDWSLGGIRNQPRTGLRTATLGFNYRYGATTYDAALTAHTTVPVTITFTKTDEALSTGFAQLQLVFPACKIQAGARVSPSRSTPTADLTLKVMKPDTGNAVYLVHRTAATAL